MGMFDTINVGGRVGQTKALGKALRVFHVGDEVVLTEARRAASADDPNERTRAEVPSFQIAMPEGGVVVIEDHRIVAWEDEPRADLLLVGNLGHPIEKPAI